MPGGSDTVAIKINNHGQVIGTTVDAGGQRRPFLYSDGVMTTIPGIPAAGTPLDINDSGAIVGQMVASNQVRGFLYSGGVLTDLTSTLDVDWVAPAGINASGQIVGWVRPFDDLRPSYFAFWLSNGVLGLFPRPPGTYYSNPYEINTAGQAAGDLGVFTNATAVLEHAHIFQYDRLIDLGALPGGTYSAARAINDAGHVAGWSGLDYRGPTNLNATHATLYRDGRVLDLGALPGDLNSFAYDLNNADWVVGISESLEEHNRAFLYTDGTLHDLNDLLKKEEPGLELSGATGVNDHGQIVGYGIRNGRLRGFLLTPKKELKP